MAQVAHDLHALFVQGGLFGDVYKRQVENRGRTMTRGDLVDRIWTDGAEYVDENAFSVTIKRLSDKLGAK